MLAIFLGFQLVYIPTSNAADIKACQNALKIIIENKYDNKKETFVKVIPASNPTKSELKIMAGLEKNGGTGRVAILQDVFYGNRVELTQETRVIEILTPPTDYRYGAAMGEVHQKLKEKGIPFVIDLNMSPFIGGMVVVANGFHPTKSRAVMMIPPVSSKLSRGSIVLRHELQHVYDMVSNIEDFIESLPALPKSFDKIIEKIKKRETLEPIQRRRLRHAEDYPRIAAEAKASEQSIKALLTRQGFKEIFLTKNVAHELATVMNEVINVFGRNFELLYNRLWIDPLNPKNVIILAKAGVYGGVLGYAGYALFKITNMGTMWVLNGISYVITGG